MNLGAITKRYTTPFTLRVFEALPGNSLWKGLGFTFILLVLFFVGRSLAAAGEASTPDDFRIAITQILITGYSATAYVYLLETARKTMLELSPVGEHMPHWPALVDRAGKHLWWLLLLVGAASYLIVGVGVTNATTPEPVNPWDWRAWNYDVFWHRASTVTFVWWFACFCHVSVVESVRLSRLAGELESLDLLDLNPYRPLVRQGLTNALLVIGMVSMMSLLGVESRYWPVLVGFWAVSIALAWAGMMLPLHGIRKKISDTRDQELDWCRRSLKYSRDALKSGAGKQPSIAEIVAYRSTIENIGNWPFDSSTLVRFSLYLLIPLGSWLGGAFVERGLDFFLS